MADTKYSETRRDMDTMRARGEAMCGARRDRFGVTDTPLREGLPRATARPTVPYTGDSGAIVSMLTGGGGATEETSITYVTPYRWLSEQIKKVLPGYYLYDVVR